MGDKQGLNKSTLLASIQTRVRIDDVNYGNHLCHTRFANLIHDARLQFLKKHNLSEANCFGYILVMLKMDIEYFSKCYFDDVLEIEIYSEYLDKIRFGLSYSIINKTTNKLAAKVRTFMGFFDYNKNKIARMPKEFKEWMMILSLSEKIEPI